MSTENHDLPGFVTIKPALSHGGVKNWSWAFLPGSFQGTAIGNAGMNVADIQGEPIEYLLNKKFTPEQQRYELDMLQNINRKHAELRRNDPQLEARIQAFELAFRMQAKAPAVFQVEQESEATKKLYGLDETVTRDFGWQCLLARRLAERGVRFIQCTHSYKWDQHGQLYTKHTENAREVDKPIAGLLKDLKSRGLLKDTLVIWAGVFGRTPVSQGNDGRDHNPYGITTLAAGHSLKTPNDIQPDDQHNGPRCIHKRNTSPPNAGTRQSDTTRTRNRHPRNTSHKRPMQMPIDGNTAPQPRMTGL